MAEQSVSDRLIALETRAEQFATQEQLKSLETRILGVVITFLLVVIGVLGATASTLLTESKTFLPLRFRSGTPAARPNRLHNQTRANKHIR